MLLVFYALFFWLQGMWGLSAQPGTDPTFHWAAREVSAPPSSFVKIIIFF